MLHCAVWARAVNESNAGGGYRSGSGKPSDRVCRCPFDVYSNPTMNN